MFQIEGHRYNLAGLETFIHDQNITKEEFVENKELKEEIKRLKEEIESLRG